MRFSRFRVSRTRPLGIDTPRMPRGAWARIRRWSLWILPALGVLALHLTLFPPIRSVERIRFEPGAITEQEVRAPFAFRAPRPVEEVEEARRIASQRVEPIYRLDEAAARRSREGVEEFFNRIHESAGQDSLPRTERLAVLRESYPGLEVSVLSSLLDVDRLERVEEAVRRVVGEMVETGVVDVTPRGTYRSVRIFDGEEESRRVPVGDLILSYRLGETVGQELGRLLDESLALEAGVAIARYFLLPTLDYDDAATQARRESIILSVPTERDWARNERILDAGERVDRDDVAVLEALEQARVQRALDQDVGIRFRMWAGRTLLLLVILGGLIVLTRQVDPSLVWETNRYLLLMLLLGIFVGISALALRNPDWGGVAAVPVALLGMLGVILYGEDLANRIVTAGILALLVMPEHLSSIALAWGAVSVVSIRSLRRVRNRNQFYRALMVVASTAAVTVLAVEFAEAASLTEAGRQALIAVLSVVVCTALTLFLLPLFEAVFGVTTELTLLELSDLNHPLLRRMALESPGTFHHSQVVGMLAEAGARAIQANPLLTRVGANFHDIGKMLKPRYFSENQSEGNPHDELRPQMSALVIASHVKEGIELGREWGLPSSVLAFIPEHHGTSVMQFFYKKALEDDEGGAVKVDDFRYPGPRPRSKETAILMLADGAEAAVRSLRRPTASRIREMVRNIINTKMAEGELEESGLTLREVAAIREAFIPVLMGIHHQRVSYPGQQAHEEKKEKESREARARSR